MTQPITVMKRDAALMRGEGPVVFAQVKHDIGVDDIIGHLEAAYRLAVKAERE
jgi:urease accessory protein